MNHIRQGLALLLCLAPLAAVADGSARLRALEIAARDRPEQTIAESSQGLRVATQNQDRHEQLWALAGLVEGHKVREKDMAALRELADRGAGLAGELGQHELLAMFLGSQAFVLRRKELPQARIEAARRLDEAIELTQRHGLHVAQAKALNSKAMLYNEQGEYARELSLLLHAHRLFEESRDAYWTGVVLINIVVVYLHLSDVAELDQSALRHAIRYGQAAIDVIADRPRYLPLSHAHDALGVAYDKLGDAEAARRHWLGCVDAARELGYTQQAAVCEYRIAQLAVKQGRHEEALRLLSRLLPQFEQTGLKGFRLRALLLGSEALSHLGRGVESVQSLHEAQAATHSMGSAIDALPFHKRAADVHARLGHHALALKHLWQARLAEQQLAVAAAPANELRVRFEVEQVERENETLRARQRAQQSDRLALALILALAGILAAGLAWAVVGRERRRRQLAEAANAAKARLLAAASGELRQPVRVVNENLLRLADLGLPAPGALLLADAQRCAATIDEMFHALLDLSKLDAAEQPVHVQAFALQPLLERVQLQFGPQARAKGLMLKVHPSRAWVSSDAQLVERIVHNFVANALRYTERGRVVVGCRAAGRRVRLAVYDSGPGIPPDQHDAIFEEFYQVPRPQGERAKGLGLGLAIVKRLARLLGVPVVLRSRPGAGSMFAIELPRVGGEARMKPRVLDVRQLQTGAPPVVIAGGVDHDPSRLLGDS